MTLDDEIWLTSIINSYRVMDTILRTTVADTIIYTVPHILRSTVSIIIKIRGVRNGIFELRFGFGFDGIRGFSLVSIRCW